jgi:hypothetical protein
MAGVYSTAFGQRIRLL